MAITAETRTAIIEIVVGMFDAAPGEAVLSELTAAVDAGVSLGDLTNILADTSVFKAIYPNFLTNEEFATEFLGDLLGNTVTTELMDEAVDIAVTELNAGMTRGDLVWLVIDFMSDVAEDDPNLGAAATAFNNKVEVAEYYSVTLKLNAATLEELQGVIVDVDGTQASVDAAKAIADGTAAQGETFVLTIETDAIVGTAGNDTFRAGVSQGTIDIRSTLDTTDNLDGQNGDDELIIFATEAITQPGAGTVDASPVINNIETITVRASTGANVDLTSADINGLETLNIESNGANAVNVAIDEGAALEFNDAGTGAVAVSFAQSNDSTLDVTMVDSASVSLAVTAADTIDALDLTIDGDAALTLSGVTVESVDVAGTGDATVSLTAATSVTSVNAGDLAGGLSIDLSSATGGTVDVVGGTGDDAITADASANDLTVALGMGDDVLDISGTTGGIDTDDSLAGGDGSDRLIIDAADLAAVTEDIVSSFEILELGAGAVTAAVTNLDFDTLYPDLEELVVSASVTSTSIDLDNGDGKTFTYAAAVDGLSNLVVNADGTGDSFTLNIDSSNAAIALTNVASSGVDDIDINLELGGANNIGISNVAVTGAETADISIAATAAATGAVSVGAMTVDADMATLDISADSVSAATVNVTAESFALDITGDSVAITALTVDAETVSLNLGGHAIITAATIATATAVDITSGATSNAISSLSGADLEDVNIAITGGDFTLVSGAANTALETITITGEGDLTSLVVNAASTALETVDLSGFSGEIATTNGLNLSGLTVGVDVLLGELSGATTADSSAEILLGATNNVRDDIVFTADFEGIIEIDNFEAGGDIGDDNLDLSAFNLSGGTNDLSMSDDGTHTTIEAGNDEFSFTIVLMNTTLVDLNTADFIF